MANSFIGQLVVFVLILIGLNVGSSMIGFPLHISIIGSVAITLILVLVFRMMRSKS